MSDTSGVRYDVFISYAQSDRDWVATWLLPRLEQAGLRVAVDFRDFVVGMPRLENIENAVRASRRTIVVLTPEWLADEWNAFEGLLVRALDPAARRRKLLPVVLRPCELPDGLAALERVDLTAERHWERQVQRLTRDIQDLVPVPAPWQEGRGQDWAAWRRWLRRYRRQLRLGLALIVVAWLGISMLLGLPPFQMGPGWQAMAVPSRDQLTQVATAGDILFASGSTEHAHCDTDVGLWRSTDGGAQWQPVRAPLCFEDVDGQSLTSISSFAWSDLLPARIYAATTNTGLLRSDDAGETWARLAPSAGQEQLVHLPDALEGAAVLPDDPDTVIAAGTSGGLFRSRDGGHQWVRLDEPVACPQPSAREQSLPGNLLFGKPLAAGAVLYVANGKVAGLRPGPEAGLYASHDGGDCWQRIDNAESRYSYAALAAVPSGSGELVAVTQDHAAEDGSPEYGVWLVREDQGRIRPALDKNPSVITSVYLEPGPDRVWYTASWDGKVRRGRVDGAGGVASLPSLTRCLIPTFCDLAGLAPDVRSGPPLLYAGNRVYRLGTVKWYQRLWP